MVAHYHGVVGVASSNLVIPIFFAKIFDMKVKRIEFPNFNISIGVKGSPAKPTVRREFVDNDGLNIYHPKFGNPVVEDLMDKVVSRRSIPLNDGIETLYAIKEKARFLGIYIDDCINELLSYKGMV